AIQLWPTYEFAQLSKRWVGGESAAGWNDRIPYTIHTSYSLPARAVVETMLPSPYTYTEIAPFLGGVAVSLALLRLAADWNDRPAEWIAAVGALSLAYALGAATPFHGWVYALSPMMARARTPIRAFLFFDLALAVLAGYGLHTILARTSPVWARRIGWFMAA